MGHPPDLVAARLVNPAQRRRVRIRYSCEFLQDAELGVDECELLQRTFITTYGALDQLVVPAIELAGPVDQHAKNITR